MRKILILGIGSLLSSACSLVPQLAPELTIPNKPLLKKEILFLTYEANHEAVKIKSVQLPAHPVERAKSVKIDSKSIQLPQLQKQTLVNLLSAKQLNVIESEQADYVLTVQQFSNEKVSDKKLLLKKSKGEKLNSLNIQNLQHSIFCADNEVNISLRLNHKQSADVIWIAQASITSHSYTNEPVIYKLTQQQKISNEHVVLDFVQRQNTEAARQKRFN